MRFLTSVLLFLSALACAAQSIQREATFTTGGLQGTIRTFSRADGAYRIETAVPSVGYRSVTTFDGKRAWKADGAARAHELTGLELADVVMDAKLAQPEALPQTLSRKTAAGTITLTIEEWTTVEGHKLPAVIKQSNGNPQFDTTIRYTATKIGETLDDSLFAKPAVKSAVQLSKPYLEFPFEFTQNHIYVPVTISGKTSWFVLDTGAEATVIDSQVAASLGLTGSGSVEARGNGENTVAAKPIAKPSLTLAGIALPIETMYAVPLRALWPREGRAMEGVLGFDALSHFVVEVDYAASRVRLHDPERFVVPDGATSLPMSYEGNVPAIRATFELPGGRRVEGRMIVDTGNSGGIDLYGPFVEANKIRAAVGRTIEGAGGMGVGGVSKQDVARIAAFHLGPFALRAPIVTLSRDEKGSAAHPELAGNLGSRALRRFTVFIDYPHDRLLLLPNANLEAPFESDMSGTALIADGEAFDRVVVRRVFPETAAAIAGLKDGDEITAIDGQKLSVHRVRELFLQPDKTYAVSVKRRSETMTVSLTTKRAI